MARKCNLFVQMQQLSGACNVFFKKQAIRSSLNRFTLKDRDAANSKIKVCTAAQVSVVKQQGGHI